MQRDIYTEITDRIIAALEQGVVPWRSPILGRSQAGHPANLASRKPYRGINIFLLALTSWSRGYGSSFWVTFKQALAAGGAVRRGEKASPVVFWTQHEVTDAKTGDRTRVPVLRFYRVFNVEQCDGVIAPDAVPFEPTEVHPVEAADAIVAGYAGAPSVQHGGSQAFYRPRLDTVFVPEASRFASTEDYYATLFHELAHSTGHSSRLARGLDTDPQPFGSADYGREELVAEMAAAFLCGHCGVHPAVIDNQAAYVGGWLRTIKSDKRLVVTAAGAAQRATDWVLGTRPQAGAASDSGE